MNYFKLYLQNYMRQHSFEPSEITSDFVTDRAESAAQTFESFRKSGASIVGAQEVAIRDLFAGVGESIWDTASDILEENFAKRIEIERPMIQDFWTQQLSDNKDIWTPYAMTGGVGLDEEKVKLHRNDIIAEIDQFLISHGL